MKISNSLSVALFFLGTLLLTGCGPKTTVVLLPEEDGKVGQLVVETEAGKREISEPRTATTVSEKTSLPSEPTRLSAESIEKDFGAVLSLLPQQPRHFLLYFQLGSENLTPESAELMTEVVATIDRNKSQNISVVGHADRSGDDDYNLKLSRKRAAAIAGILEKAGVPAEFINTTSHGENNPLIPTADGVAEPKNRRVEVVVR